MNILITSVGRRSYLVDYFKEAIENNGKIFAVNNIFTPALLTADYYEICPSIYDDNYIEYLLNFCNKNQVDAIISVFDVDLPILSKNRELFEKNGIKLIVSNYEFVKICNDKWKTYEFLKKHNIPTIKTFLDINEVKLNIDKGELDYPIVIKPRFGMGSIGIYIAYNQLELEIFSKVCLNKINNTYLKYESNEYIQNVVLYQEYIDAQEYGLDIINDLKGDYVNTICKKKIAMRAGETDIAETVDIPQLKEFGRLISNAGRHIANLDCDVLIKDNRIYFMELNARFGGGYPFSHMAGINLPKAIIEWISGRNGNKYILNEKVGVRSYKEICIVSY